MAARTLLTDEVRERLDRELAAGTTQAAAAQRVGVSPRTVRHWPRQGHVKRPPPRRAQPLLELDPRPLREHLVQAEPGLVVAIIQAAQRGSWQAAAWLLERLAPDRWARREPGPV